MSGDRARAGAPSVIEWENLSKTGGDMLIDVEKVQRAARINPRVLTGTFQAPRGISRVTLERGTKTSVNSFLTAMQKQGWELISRVEITGPFTAREINSSVVLLDKAEFKVRGVFKHKGKVETVRLQLPPSWIKQAPDQAAPAGGPRTDISPKE